jgi:hypothetical protein
MAKVLATTRSGLSETTSCTTSGHRSAKPWGGSPLDGEVPALLVAPPPKLLREGSPGRQALPRRQGVNRPGHLDERDPARAFVLLRPRGRGDEQNRETRNEIAPPHSITSSDRIGSRRTLLQPEPV